MRKQRGGLSALALSGAICILALSSCPTGRRQPVPETRDPLSWPFARDSIWNMPIGSEAVYVVDNNAPDRIGGGGTPRAPLAPPLQDPGRD